MTHSIGHRAPSWWRLVAALAVTAIVSCGGGGVVGSGGTGRAAGVAVGTVNGFGSLIVDGVGYDNRGVPAVSELAPGQDTVTDVRLGERVAVEYEASGVASVVRVDAALAGAVASVVSPSRFTLLGQTVTVNANGAAGPITQFGGGYTQGADVRAGDAIEVHGLLVPQNGSTLIQATRIDKLAAAPAYLRVTSVVSAVNAGAAVTLGALTVDIAGATVLPAGTVLAVGQTVTVLALPNTLTMPSAGSWRVQAAQLRIRELRDGGLDDYVSGSVAQLDAQAKTFVLGSLRVRYASASLTPTTMVLANGAYVQVRGMVAADGSLAAASVMIRDAGADTEAHLRGNISAFDRATSRFVVRGTSVDASRASVQGCPAAGLANGLFVEVEGAVGSSAVVATQVHCEDEPSDATVEREGTAAGVDAAAMSFSLVPQQGTIVSVKWTSTTFFGSVTPATLAGKSVHVQGTLVNGVLMASTITLDR